jgi:hypothetical protein
MQLSMSAVQNCPPIKQQAETTPPLSAQSTVSPPRDIAPRTNIARRGETRGLVSIHEVLPLCRLLVVCILALGVSVGRRLRSTSRSVASTVTVSLPNSRQHLGRSASPGAGGARGADEPALDRAAGESWIAGVGIVEVQLQPHEPHQAQHCH